MSAEHEGVWPDPSAVLSAARSWLGQLKLELPRLSDYDTAAEDLGVPKAGLSNKFIWPENRNVPPKRADTAPGFLGSTADCEESDFPPMQCRVASVEKSSSGLQLVGGLHMTLASLGAGG